jgi:hypothetical protein
MKVSTAALLFLFICGAGARADGPTVGRIEITIWPDDGNDFTSVEFRDEGDKIVGEGTGLTPSDDTIYLERKDGALAGFVLGTPFNVSCTEDTCSDRGPTDVNLKLKRDSRGLHLDGTLGFEFVDAIISDKSINVSSDASFEATGTGDGRYSGTGAFDGFEIDPSFQVEIVTEGSLKSFPDPSVFVISVLRAFTRVGR